MSAELSIEPSARQWEPVVKEARKFVKYTFFKLQSNWRQDTTEVRQGDKEEFLRVLDDFSEKLTLRTYSLVGTRADCDFMVWTIADRLEELQALIRGLFSTRLGRFLTISHSFLAMTRQSEYLGDHRHPGQEGAELKKEPGRFRYLFVYPFTKKRSWYKLPYEERRRMMLEHFQVGYRYPTVKINTAYSFGLDDQEFMLSFETDYPADFLELVMELRSSEASQYTEVETPLFTCIATTPAEMIDSLGI